MRARETAHQVKGLPRKSAPPWEESSGPQGLRLEDGRKTPLSALDLHIRVHTCTHTNKQTFSYATQHTYVNMYILCMGRKTHFYLCIYVCARISGYPQKVVMNFPGAGVTVIVSCPKWMLRTELFFPEEQQSVLTSTINGSFNSHLQDSGRLLFEKPTPMLSSFWTILSSLMLKPILKCLC